MAGSRLTLEAWIQPTAGSGPGTIATRGTAANGYDYRLVWDDGVLAVTILTAAGATRVVAATGPAAAPPGAISHVVVTLDDTTDNIRFYVNGADVAMSSATWSGVSTVQAADALVVGRASDQAGAFFAGVIDEVAVYDSVLSPQRIAEHHAAGSIP